ncbi:uncharacterized protein LOC112454335 [Temnothorax curvispinosus]|uniref:Uncharacterized protein LOC112454335 n=1 Tax=Temnothorax curvispinosus TaxID=300111 RepID=A0A6J1PNZ9_9HYME|nr:uncharacterized protein LOC112454335 [Temnothorax curvispinosus]
MYQDIRSVNCDPSGPLDYTDFEGLCSTEALDVRLIKNLPLENLRLCCFSPTCIEKSHFQTTTNPCGNRRRRPFDNIFLRSARGQLEHRAELVVPRRTKAEHSG